MIDVAALTAAALVCAAGVMSPGPNFIAVTHRALSGNRREALALVLGIVCVNLLWASAALFGLGVVFKMFPWVFWAVKLSGAAYLVWLGVQMMRRAKADNAAAVPKRQTTPGGQSLGALWPAFRSGVMTNLSNPKSMLFYVSVFSAAVPARASTSTLLAMIGMVAAIGLLWYGGVGIVLSTARAAQAYRHSKAWIERACGAFLVFFGTDKRCSGASPQQHFATQRLPSIC